MLRITKQSEYLPVQTVVTIGKFDGFHLGHRSLLAEVLKEHGFVMMDTQMVTNLTASFGAREVPCSEYFSLLDRYGAAPERMTF